MSLSKCLEIVLNYWPSFLLGIKTTLIISLAGTIIGLLIGLMVGGFKALKFDKKSPIKTIIDSFITIYIEIFRGTPMMVQAVFIYYLVYTNIIRWDKMTAAIFVISINTGAYMSEIIRSGLNGVDKGQEEASRSLGMPYWTTMFCVIMPQAIKNSIPTILNEYIVNVKDSSVLNVIGLTELYASVSIATNKNYFKVEGYVIVAVIYLCLTLLATLIVRIISRKQNGEKAFVFPWSHAKKAVN